MSDSFLGTVSPKVLKKLKKIRPNAPQRVANTEIYPLSTATDTFVNISEIPSPEWLSCGMAYPHTDWDSYFLCVSMLGRREFGEYVDRDHISYLTIIPGTVFVVDGSKLHWLMGSGNSIPRGWWMGLQWELNPDKIDCAYVANKILNLLETKTIENRRDLDQRYHSWI